MILYILFGMIIMEVFHLIVWEWLKDFFNLDKKKVRGIFVFMIIAIVLSTVLSGVYVVESQQEVIVTTMGGNRDIRTVGMHFDVFSGRQPIDLRKQVITFPEDSYGSSDKTVIIITSDEKPVDVSAILEYKIINTRVWGIESFNTESKLSDAFKSSVLGNIQNANYSSIITEKSKVSDNIFLEILDIEELYGIEILRVDLVRASDSNAVISAKSNAEAQKIESASMIKSFESEAEALRLKYDSIEDKDFIMYIELIKAIKEGNVHTIVVPENLNPLINVMGDDT